MGRTAPLITRLIDKMSVDERTLCWVFVGARNPKGYGSIRDSVRRRNNAPHRLAYELWVGPIGDGLEIDHRCFNRACFNPDHLRAVPHITNIRGSVPFRPKAPLSTSCYRNHDQREYVRHADGKYRCRACQRLRKEQNRG